MGIQFRWLLAVEVEPHLLIECCFAWVLSIARHGTGTRLSPLRVEFAQPRAHQKAIERHFGCPVVCGASHNAIVFRASDAQRPFVTRNAELLAMLAPQYEAELKEQIVDEDFAERVAAPFSKSSRVGVRRSMILRTRFISARALCSAVCRMQARASGAFWRRRGAHLRATTSIIPFSN